MISPRSVAAVSLPSPKTDRGVPVSGAPLSGGVTAWSGLTQPDSPWESDTARCFPAVSAKGTFSMSGAALKSQKRNSGDCRFESGPQPSEAGVARMVKAPERDPMACEVFELACSEGVGLASDHRSPFSLASQNSPPTASGPAFAGFCSMAPAALKAEAQCPLAVAPLTTGISPRGESGRAEGIALRLPRGVGSDDSTAGVASGLVPPSLNSSRNSLSSQRARTWFMCIGRLMAKKNLPRIGPTNPYKRAEGVL